ncbi:MAG: UDP-3-O-(3-hydroxymyristoyl)glucosamine N-acyltransferase [Sulfurospirillaceae bacterium]|nr:UDP-3-O-(3-hydroxymyristoyl)glucosamine N-acyltransferase [Sulfurospirillaceae bacterium]MDD3463777.1 UDP-3-O-(3-hydroxymyristoyl)glucosamine N-acyltransferase [Sulfurospirillaceae bacterium]
MKLSELAKYIDAEFLGLDRDISSLSGLKEASSSQISYLENSKMLDVFKQTKAGAVIVSKEFAQYAPKDTEILISDNPHLSMAKASKYFAKIPFDGSKKPFIEKSAFVEKDVFIGSETVIEEGVRVMSGVRIGANVRIGKNTLIYPNTVIYDDCIVGENCIIQANVVVGSDGFGYAHTKEGEHIKIYHSGNVILENDVEIGSGTTIDKAVFGSTRIGKGTKIDNLVQIGHNCETGQSCIIVSQVGLSGSTKLGRNVIMGGQSATSGHLEIGDFAMIAARGGVSKSIKGGETYGGFPLVLQKEWLKTQVKLAKFLKTFQGVNNER